MCVRRSFHVKKIPKFLKLFLFKGTKNGFIRTRIGGGREREREERYVIANSSDNVDGIETA